MNKIMGTLVALPLLLSVTAFAADPFSAGDKAVGKAPVPTAKPVLIERTDSEGKRTLFNASAVAGATEEMSEAKFHTFVENNEKAIQSNEVKIAALPDQFKDKPTTAWRSCGYSRPWVYYTSYYDYYPTSYYSYYNYFPTYYYVPLSYYYYSYSYAITTVTYYGGYLYSRYY